MTPVKDCIAKLKAHNIDANAEPYLGAVRFHCLHEFPIDEIVWHIVSCVRLHEMVSMLADGQTLSPTERLEAIALFKSGKSVLEVMKHFKYSPKTP